MCVAYKILPEVSATSLSVCGTALFSANAVVWDEEESLHSQEPIR